MSGLYDFTDTSDLSVELQKRLAGGGKVNPNIAVYADIVKAGNAAGASALSISMIEAVAARMGLTAISQQAMRNALNGAIKAGLIQKVTRQTYGVKGIVDETPEVATEDSAPEAPVADESDPLA